MTITTSEHTSKIEVADGDTLQAIDVRGWLLSSDIPDGAVITKIVRDFGTQRDPDVRLIGLRAEWAS